MMRVICIHVRMVAHVTVRVMGASDVCVQPAIPVVNVKHSSPMIISAICPTHASMEAHVYPHHGVPIPIRVCVRMVIRGYDVSRVCTPPLVVTRVRVPMGVRVLK